jgi:flagellar hook-basal body complex protein FliE
MNIADAVGAISDAAFLAPTWKTALQTVAPESFEQVLMSGLNQVSAQVSAADEVTTRFALDDKTPPHQALIAMEQAHVSMSLMLQVRARLVQGYQQLMQMQL